MPKVELEVYDGNPLLYHHFISAFDSNIDKICDNGDSKLARLVQYTSGPPREAIRSCQVVGGDDGYQLARKILSDRFGNAHLVSTRMINN